MCARSHASGLISVECARLHVRRRRAARPWPACARAPRSGRRTGVASWLGHDREVSRDRARRVRASRAQRTGAAPHLDDLADRRGAVGDPASSGRTASSKRPGLELLELGHERVEAAALLVHQHDVAGADALRGRRRARRRGGGRRRGTSIRRSWCTGRNARSPPRTDAATASQTRAVQRDVRLAVGPDLDDRRALGGERASSAARKPARSSAALVAEAVERGGVGEVEPVRRGDVLARSRSPSRGDREEVEDAAAVVVDQHDRERQPEPAARRAGRRCRGRARRRRSAARPVPARRRRRRRSAVETVPSIPLAPRLESTRGGGVAGGEERLDVAHGHRGGDDERRVGRQPDAELGGHARLGELAAERRRDRLGRRAVGARATPSSHSRRPSRGVVPAPARAGRR